MTEVRGVQPPDFNDDRAVADFVDVFTRKKYNLKILRDGYEYPAIIRSIEAHFNNLEREKNLLLPDLSYENETLAIFSDYGGESKDGKCFTYSFLVCALQHTGVFNRYMQYVRSKHQLGDKEISYKDMGYGPINRSLDDYLKALNFVPGLLFTVIIDKEAVSLIPRALETNEVLEALKQRGLGEWKATVVEKLLRICHIAAYLVSLLASKGQKVFWMTDDDAIVANERLAQHWLNVFGRLLSHYCREELSFIGGGPPFKGKHLETLDLLSSADIVAGCFEHYYTQTWHGLGDIKPEVMRVLRWLCHDFVVLKKQAVMIQKGHKRGAISAGSVDLKLEFEDSSLEKIPVYRP